MTIEATKTDATSMTLSVMGQLSTGTAPLLERKIQQVDTYITELTLDCSRLEYISSAGLRVILQTQKTMKRNGGKLIIKNLTGAVREVFEMTGFLNLFVREEKLVVIRKDEPSLIRLYLAGQLDHTTASLLETELSQIREQNRMRSAVFAVDLDIEKLLSPSDDTYNLLQQIIEKTAWDRRKLSITNASGPVPETIRKLG